MNIYAAALKAKGVTVTTKPNIGARPVYIPALQDGSIDLIPEYTGNLLSYFRQDRHRGLLGRCLHRAADRGAVGPDGARPAQAQDKDAIVVTKATATSTT